MSCFRRSAVRALRASSSLWKEGEAIDRAIAELGGLDLLVSNVAHQNRKKQIEKVTDEEFDRRFETKRLYVPHCLR
jgi:NAD(P)-dependent dehydrogenase (short-subunit alcohol dehydrogenase family)